jgi:hypothetical protein
MWENHLIFPFDPAFFRPSAQPGLVRFGHSAEFFEGTENHEKKSPMGGFYTCFLSAFLL